VVLLSGSGTTLQNFIDLMEAGKLPIAISLVISNKADAYGLVRARNHGIPTQCILRAEMGSKEAFHAAVADSIREEDPDLILLAGYMTIFRPDSKYYARTMNVHPALIPAFCGKGMYGHHVHEAVIESGVKVTGVTVHFADEHYDSGPIILQQPVFVADSDTPESLAEKVQAAERNLYPQAIRLFAGENLQIHGKRVKIVDTK
ncbi:phosphoribosylglycinamide formyltransferase, partial [bacterium]|nr:phosphoribosylglycinamide formyltransferase [bacterium]